MGFRWQAMCVYGLFPLQEFHGAFALRELLVPFGRIVAEEHLGFGEYRIGHWDP